MQRAEARAHLVDAQARTRAACEAFLRCSPDLPVVAVAEELLAAVSQVVTLANAVAPPLQR